MSLQHKLNRNVCDKGLATQQFGNEESVKQCVGNEQYATYFCDEELATHVGGIKSTTHNVVEQELAKHFCYEDWQHVNEEELATHVVGIESTTLLWSKELATYRIGVLKISSMLFLTLNQLDIFTTRI